MLCQYVVVCSWCGSPALSASSAVAAASSSSNGPGCHGGRAHMGRLTPGAQLEFTVCVVCESREHVARRSSCHLACLCVSLSLARILLFFDGANPKAAAAGGGHGRHLLALRRQGRAHVCVCLQVAVRTSCWRITWLHTARSYNTRERRHFLDAEPTYCGRAPRSRSPPPHSLERLRCAAQVLSR